MQESLISGIKGGSGLNFGFIIKKVLLFSPLSIWHS